MGKFIFSLSRLSATTDVLSTALPHPFPVPGCQEIPFSSSSAEEPALIQALDGGDPSPLPMAVGKWEMELRLAEPVLLQDPLMDAQGFRGALQFFRAVKINLATVL